MSLTISLDRLAPDRTEARVAGTLRGSFDPAALLAHHALTEQARTSQLSSVAPPPKRTASAGGSCYVARADRHMEG